MLGCLDMTVDDLHEVVGIGHVFIDVGDYDFALVVLVEYLLLHHAAAHRGHLGPVLGVHDGGNYVAAERRTDLVEQVGVFFVGLDVLVITNFELGAVGGKSAYQRAGDPGAEVASDDGRAHQADLGIFFLEEVHQYVGVGSGSIGEESGGIEDEELVHSVGEYLALDFSGDAAAGSNCVQLHTKLVGQLAALGEEFLGDFGNCRALYLAIYEYVVFHSSTR